MIVQRRHERAALYARRGNGTWRSERGITSNTSHYAPPNALAIKANILVDQNDRARLADFGLLTIVSDCTHPTTSTSLTNAGTVRWMSPELFDPDRFGFENSRRTKESDRYALGMVILEVLSGQTPFPSCVDMVVTRKVTEGERPRRPQGAKGMWFTDDVWRMLEQCWSPQPKDRPDLRAVLGCLERASAVWQPQPVSADDDDKSDSDNESLFTVSYPCIFFYFISNLTSPTRRKSRGLLHLVLNHWWSLLQSVHSNGNLLAWLLRESWKRVGCLPLLRQSHLSHQRKRRL